MKASEFLRLIKSNGEWDNAYLVDFSYLENTNHWSKGVMHNKKVYDIHFCPVPISISLEKVKSEKLKIILWGATAKIIWNFFKKHRDDVNFS